MQLAGNAGPKKLQKICHLGTIAQLYRAISSQLRYVSTIGKTVVKQQYLPHKFHMVNFGPVTAKIRSGVWGTPPNFNRFRVLAALLHGTSGRQPNFAALKKGATYIRQGSHHVGH